MQGYHGEDIVGFAKELAEEQGDRLLSLGDEERFDYFRTYGLEKELDKSNAISSQVRGPIRRMVQRELAIREQSSSTSTRRP